MVSPDNLKTSSHNNFYEREHSERYIHPSGVSIEKIIVWDESQKSETFLETRQMLDDWDAELRAFDDPKPPIFDKYNQIIEPKNPVSERFYSDSSIQEWGLLMPSARALYYLTHLDVKTLPSGQPISDNMTRFMREMDDGIGIRTRKRIASKLVLDKIRNAHGEVRCLSLACGAADLMLETLAASGHKANLTLVDTDDDALSMARAIATDQRLIENKDYFIEKTNLINSMVRSDKFVKQIGEESQQVVDAIGINEYFSVPIATKFLANAYRCVKPGGSLITANMLSGRTQMQINKTAIGWPKIYPRSTDDIIDMIYKAGLPLKHTKIIIPDDGIYAVIEISKPDEMLNNAN